MIEPALPEALVALIGDTADLPHLVEALTHPSFANESKRERAPHYQRLEFLGDAVLGLFVSEELFRRFPDAPEGTLSRLRSSVVSTEALAGFARELGLGGALRLGRGAGLANEREQDSVLADALEAVIGAVYTDRGREAAQRIALAILGHHKLEADPLRDAKSALQERLQAEGASAPRYEVVAAEGPPHQRTFTVRVSHEDRALGEGVGRSKKAAEQEAAKVALAALETERAAGEPR